MRTCQTAATEATSNASLRVCTLVSAGAYPAGHRGSGSGTDLQRAVREQPSQVDVPDLAEEQPPEPAKEHRPVRDGPTLDVERGDLLEQRTEADADDARRQWVDGR